MTEPKPEYRTQQPRRSYGPIEITDCMAPNQADQFLRVLRGIISHGEGAVMIVVGDHHVRFISEFQLEYFERPER